MRYDLVIVGSGESGTGAAILAHKIGMSVFVSDKGLIGEKYKADLIRLNIPFEEGMHSEDIILDATLIVKSPGIPEKAHIIQKIRSRNIPIISEIEFAFRNRNTSKIIAITGSNGKTTTTSLLFDIMKQDGRNVSVVGNIGNSYARQIAENPTEWYVMEISSFQLDDIDTFRPDIAVITNITPDHLDRYDYDFQKYVQAKFSIAKAQTEQNVLVVCAENQASIDYINNNTITPKIIYFTMNEQVNNEGAYVSQDEMIINANGEPFKISINELSLKGKHNVYNSMAAGISARVAEVRNESIRESLKRFSAIEHRMEFVATIRGVEFINDSKATNLNSVWYALECISKPTVLIMGGVDKGNNYKEIEQLVKDKVKAIVCLGIDNSAIEQAFTDIVPLVNSTDINEAVSKAYQIAESGDCVLLSPACASFDLFKNFEDRGQQFKNAVLAL